MKALLDTHALLWFLAGSNKLGTAALGVIQNPANTLFVSPASLWEISIKDSLGKLTLPQPFAQLFPASLDASGILILPILMPHLHAHRSLPFHHHDPFDRLIISQALTEDLTLVSCDGEFSAYGVKLLW
ncbi:MAG: type II toxin-antitoxin system VapC family toxin [Prosthecobacter sp.]|uniref:type II toxin-antitoxin system VapC family toxin n=1 Tax=Prosthecobacter sp. TaxID=1965333 RepID=UPI0025E5D457|nr:type II toxin-antitoxin system VapC family toxin [Prosthecobacter sp.]MCF7785037.1 type II toxin-antitoxin system VapC family toxin [Prosthecobacter sp.]